MNYSAVFVPVLAPVLAVFPLAPIASAKTSGPLERVYQERFCTGMKLEYRLPDATRADCLSGEYVIEVDFTEKWAESIGQALHYGLWTRELPIGPRKIGIILICHKQRDTCTDHTVRLKRVIEGFHLPDNLMIVGAVQSGGYPVFLPTDGKARRIKIII